MHDRHARPDFLGHVGGVDAVLVVVLGVAAQQRAVVATDVEHAGGRLAADEFHGLLGDAAQMVAHRVVGARAIPVGGIQNFWWYRVFHLEQAAGVLVACGIATHQRAGDAAGGRQFLAGLDEGALQVLLTQVDDFG